MAGLTTEQALLKVQLEQTMLEYLYEVDFNSGARAAEFYAEDGVFELGDFTYRSRAGIAKFYSDRIANVAVAQKDGVRTCLHSVSDVRIEIVDETHATLHFFNTQFSGEGKPPVIAGTLPTMVVACTMKFKKVGDEWQIALLKGSPLFIGGDPFLTKMIVKD